MTTVIGVLLIAAALVIGALALTRRGASVSPAMLAAADASVAELAGGAAGDLRVQLAGAAASGGARQPPQIVRTGSLAWRAPRGLEVAL